MPLSTQFQATAPGGTPLVPQVILNNCKINQWTRMDKTRLGSKIGGMVILRAETFFGKIPPTTNVAALKKELDRNKQPMIEEGDYQAVIDHLLRSSTLWCGLWFLPIFEGGDFEPEVVASLPANCIYYTNIKSLSLTGTKKTGFFKLLDDLEAAQKNLTDVVVYPRFEVTHQHKGTDDCYSLVWYYREPKENERPTIERGMKLIESVTSGDLDINRAFRWTEGSTLQTVPVEFDDARTLNKGVMAEMLKNQIFLSLSGGDLIPSHELAAMAETPLLAAGSMTVDDEVETIDVLADTAEDLDAYEPSTVVEVVPEQEPVLVTSSSRRRTAAR